MGPGGVPAEATETLHAWAEFAEAFCAGYNARKDGVRDEDGGEEFRLALMDAYEKWHGKQIVGTDALRRAIVDHRTAIHNAGAVKVRPGYTKTAMAKHRADQRLWGVLDG